jgi:hypothetical protein
MPTSVISVLDNRRISFYFSQGWDSNTYILFLQVEICPSIARFEVLRPMFMKSDVLVTCHTVSQQNYTILQNHSNGLSEYIQTNRLLQTLCTDPATVKHTLTKLRQLCYIMEVMKGLKDCRMQLCTAWWTASEVPKYLGIYVLYRYRDSDYFSYLFFYIVVIES